eukprot:130045-Pyramimonas_sp.AAC.1
MRSAHGSPGHGENTGLASSLVDGTDTMQTPRLWPSACANYTPIKIANGKAREAKQATRMRTGISSGPVAESLLSC